MRIGAEEFQLRLFVLLLEERRTGAEEKRRDPDAVFVEGPRTEAELACIATRLAQRVPLIHNLVEGGISPTDDGAELERLGFAIALHPLVLMHGFVRQAPGWLAELRKMRTTASIRHELVDLKHMNGLAGADALFELGERYDA